MIITFLGTSAANAYPEAFCQCKNCEQARKLGGHSLRKRSSLLINNDLLIDFGPDIMSASNLHRCPLSHVHYCLQTHSHADHLDPSHFLSRSPEYGVVNASRLHFYGSSGTLQVAAKLLERDCEPYTWFDPQVGERLNLAIHTIEAFQTYRVGDYLVKTFSANHDPVVEPLLYSIERNGYTVFYGTDTATLSEEVWRAFHQEKIRFDLVILDHTYGPEEIGSDHLSARDVIAYKNRMREERLLTEHGRVLGTHISHPGNPVHPELEEFAKQNGYEIAYDGLQVKGSRSFTKWGEPSI